MTIGVLQSALQGLHDNQRRAERAAQDTVRATLDTAEPPDTDLADAAVRLMVARRGFEACLAVARAADEMLGTVIDVLA
ncbi:MAG: flagellar basal body rod C-terminal domain-containing protein [Candidatus Krumholzibacteriia bacterium]